MKSDSKKREICLQILRKISIKFAALVGLARPLGLLNASNFAMGKRQSSLGWGVEISLKMWQDFC